MDNYERIIGAGNQGDFVLENQQTADREGFSHVSKSWYDKTISYDEGMEALESEVGHREDYLVPKSDIQFDVQSIDGKPSFGVSLDDGFYIPTDHALTQLVSKSCQNKGTGFVRSLRTDVFNNKDEVKVDRDFQDMTTILSIVRNGFRRLPVDSKFKLRCYDDGTMRAFLSEKYAEVDNRWYLEQIKNIVPAGRLSHWRGDADTIWGNVLIPDTIREEDDSDYGGMVSLANCEIGKRAIYSMPSVFRAICMNGCIWDQTAGTKIRVVHMGDIDLTDLAVKLRDNIEKQIPLIPQGIERLLGIRAKGTDGVAMKNLIGATAQFEKIDKRGATAILESWVKHESKIAPAERSLFDVVNSVTRAGQFLDNQSWVRYDELGGRLANYSDKKWESLKRRAADLEEADFKKIYSGQPVLSA